MPNAKDMFLKSILITSVTLLSYLVFFGQSNFPYDQEWKLIDSLMIKKNLPKSALVEVNKVYEAAKKDKQEAQWVKAIVYRNHLQETNDQNINDKIKNFDSEVTSSPKRVAALLRSLEAEELFQYLQEHRYQFRNRTAIIADTSTDITTWTANRLTNKISNLYISSLDNPDLLKKTALENFNAVLISGNSRELRPTLFDLLAWRALDYFRMDNNTGKATTIDNRLRENPVLFSEAPYYMHFGFNDNDSQSNQLLALRLYQQLLRFHTKDIRLDAWIDADISRIQFVYQIAQMPERDSLYMIALSRITRQYGTLAATSKAWFLQAQWWYEKGTTYDPLKDSVHRFDFTKAVMICEQVLRHPDSSEGKFLCGQLLDAIRKRSFNLKIEQVNIPNLPFRVLLSYKNINRLYGRIIRIDDATKESFDQNEGGKFWHRLNQMPVERYFQQQVPDTRDYQQHRVEIRIESLSSGQYILLASSDASFDDSASMVMCSFFCSNIAFVKNGMDYFVLDRDSGHPLKSVNIKSFLQRYDKGKSVYQPFKTYQTDQQGYFHLSSAREFSNQVKLEFNIGKDYLSNTQYIYYNREDENDSRDSQKFSDDIFTDRSIYRPGQTVYFKGLLISRDLKTGKYRAATQQNSKIFLLDVNRQKIDSLLLKSNEYGSIRGSFKLPQNLLNGEFTILDEHSADEKIISVEDYKRPSFYVMYDSVKDSCKVGDSIKLSGSVMAYAGNSVDRAKLIYRVYRESRFPYPWMFRFYPTASETEITSGESITDEKGKFNIQFIAEPDKSVSKSTKPIYTYRIESIVTDLNGESRSATTTLAASYQSFQISSSITDESGILKDSLYNIPVTTTNASGTFIKEGLSVSVTNLTGPARLVRKRYWEQPDQFVMSESDFIKSFPNDEFKNESDVRSWNPGPMVYSHTDSTNMNGFFKLDKAAVSSLKPGWYLIEFKAKDLDGDEIIDKKYIEIRDNTATRGSLRYNIIKEENRTGEPGTSLKIQTGSDADDLYVIRLKQTISDTAIRYSYYRLDQHINNSTIEIRESDRGGFAINDVFVKNNRWYMSVHNIVVPWTNKELQISYQTWNDKTKPGSKEQLKIKIAGYKKDEVAAEVLAAMYDASLDQFVNHSWTVPDIYPVYNRDNAWDNSSNFGDVLSRMRPDLGRTSNVVMQNIYDELLNFNDGPGGRNVRMMSVMGYNSTVMDIELQAPMKRSGNRFGKDKMELPAIELAKFTPPKIVKDEEVREEAKPTAADNMDQNNNVPVQIRKNFNETALFQPDLKTDVQGNVVITFTMPDALTKWKWMVLANSKDLSFGYSEKFVETQKELMIQTNMPRFFREGDTMLLPVKLANLSSQSLSGSVQLEWQDAGNNLKVDSNLGNINPNQPFNISASQSGVVFFPVIIPAHFSEPLLYRIIAKSNIKNAEYSDGEENLIPVLSNRMLVTESLPLNMNGQKEKHFLFEKLLKSRESTTLRDQLLTVEFTTNPAWYAVQSLPYLIEFPYECAEQTFNRFYANALASHIVQVSPAMRAVFEKWKNMDTSALLSNLQKNEELKNVLLRETPWVLQAQTETQQKKNLALLFDLIRMREALNSALDKLRQMQSGDGGFAWFKGGREDRFITQYIISGIGRLRKLKSIPVDLQVPLNNIARAAIAFVDKEIYSDYEKRSKSLTNQNLSPIQIQYLYARSFFPDIVVPANIFNALNYFKKLSAEAWTKESLYMQGMIALFLSRTGDTKTANDILASLKENAIHSPGLGMFWKSVNNGFYWQEAPVETQSLLIETFQELSSDQNTIDQMKIWLLQQKHSNHWPSTKATADACYALLLTGNDWIASQQTLSVQLGNYKFNSSEGKTEAGTGYYKKQIPGNQVVPEMGNIDVKVDNVTTSVNGQRPTVNGQPSTVNPSWGAIYWQYFENLDKITTAQTQLSINKKLFIENNSDKGPVLLAVSEKNILKPGDKLKMRIIITTDRDLEYVHLKDMRAACLEPVNVLSGYQWQDGLGYYQTTQDASTSFFFDRLARGTFVLEYPVFVTTSGNYSNGISVLECMYAPEFAAHSEGIRLHVEPR
jgi:5-hydroxyisourate hydrolase-like protein (transthyretin family)